MSSKVIVFSRLVLSKDTQTINDPDPEPTIKIPDVSIPSITLTKKIQITRDQASCNRLEPQKILNRHKSVVNRQPSVPSNIFHPTQLSEQSIMKSCMLHKLVNPLERKSINTNSCSSLTRNQSLHSNRISLNKNFSIRKLSGNVLSRIRCGSRPKRRLKIID